ncbi:MAG: hypothetical protein HXM16_05405 [Fusobacterium periodonticum]|nr:hypothetical protein [Fusobacterium periodonticum]
MDRKEEINKEIDLLEKRIISLKNERYDIIKKENPIYVDDCFAQFRRIGNAYYKIVKVTDRDIICIMVSHNTIEKDILYVIIIIRKNVLLKNLRKHIIEL